MYCKMSDEDLYVNLSKTIYQSKTLCAFIINTNPLWTIACTIGALASPIILAIFVRPGCFVPLLGVFISTFFMYLDSAANCFILSDHCDVDEDVLAILFIFPIFSLFYSTIALFVTRWTLSGIQEYMQQRKS
jgi:hypothetical protein